MCCYVQQQYFRELHWQSKPISCGYGTEMGVKVGAKSKIGRSELLIHNVFFSAYEEFFLIVVDSFLKTKSRIY